MIGLAQTSLDGRFLLVNHRLCDLLGYTVDELRALDFMRISHPDEVARDIEAGNRLIAGATDRYAREKRYRRKDGSFVWTNLTVSLHRHVGGEPNYFIAIIEDITERKRAEEEARQVHKMEAIWKDYRHGSQVRTLTLEADEFLRRFLLHVLPKRFVRIRYFGFLAPRCRTHELAQCRQALAVAPTPARADVPVAAKPRRTWPCPRCGGPMRVVERLTARQLFLEAVTAALLYDTS